jgi:hypothetical protein
MEAINFLASWSTWLLLITPLGAGVMVVYQAMMKSFAIDLDDVGHRNVMINRTIKGAIVIMSISGLITVFRSFYGF